MLQVLAIDRFDVRDDLNTSEQVLGTKNVILVCNGLGPSGSGGCLRCYRLVDEKKINGPVFAVLI